MIDGKSDCRGAEAPGGKTRWMQHGILGAVCALVIGVYAYTVHSGYFLPSTLNPADDYYNLLVQGFRAGQLNLKTDVPPGLAQLADPYDPAAHSPYPVLDMSYYKGKLYLYFGVMPALVLFWPYVALTGRYLPQKDAAVIFSLVGFLVSVDLLCALWRRYFAEVSVAVVAAGTLALGLATCTPLLLARCDVYEVSITCGYALTMLALVAIWKALHHSSQRGRWLAAASLAYGLAVGARPSLLFGAVILLVPVAQAWRERRRLWALLMAATVPIALIGLGLMLYNALRFDSPFEFGIRYQLSGQRQVTWKFFSPQFLWFNFQVYFLEPARWSARFPFVHEIAVPPLPAGYGQVEPPYGVLTNIPLVWLALAVPLAWRSRSAEARSSLRGFLAAVAVLFGICALTVNLFSGACVRYEVEFLPALLLLATAGILGLERALADQPLRQRAVRCGWGTLLGFSVAFNLLASVERCAVAHYNLGIALRGAGQMQEAIGQYEQALRLKPDFAEAHNNLGIALLRLGRAQEAVMQCAEALRITPDYVEAYLNLGNALLQTGKVPEAIGAYEQALRLKPDYVAAHYNLGGAFLQAGKFPEAAGEYEQVLQLKPDYAEAHNNLGIALLRLGKVQEAISHWDQALRIRPDHAVAHNNLGNALLQAGRVQEAIGHYEQALRINPDFVQAQTNLARARAVQ
jgi:tetratricopeptide (TPR) repeat protein